MNDSANYIKRLSTLTESPIGDWTIDPMFDSNEKEMFSKFHGYAQEKPHWREVDKKAIRDPDAVQKIRNAFTKTGFNFNIYFWQSDDPDYDRTLEKGLVDHQWIQSVMGQHIVDYFNSINYQSGINVILTNNLSDDYPMSIRSPWMVAHRISHTITMGKEKSGAAWEVENAFALFIKQITTFAYGVRWPNKNDFNYSHYMSIEDSYVSDYGKILAHELGTMRSAKNKMMVNGYEWLNETFAQYLMTGHVTINPILPSEIHPDEPLTTDPIKLAKANKALAAFPRKIERLFKKMLVSAVGKFWVN